MDHFFPAVRIYPFYRSFVIDPACVHVNIVNGIWIFSYDRTSGRNSRQGLADSQHVVSQHGAGYFHIAPVHVIAHIYDFEYIDDLLTLLVAFRQGRGFLLVFPYP